MQQIRIVDVSPARSVIWAHRSIRAVNPPGKADPDWDTAIRSKPRFANIPLHTSDRAPLGTAKPFVPGSFASREAEFNFLVATQDLDVARVDQELAQINLSAFSADDPLSPAQQITDANISALRSSGTPYELPDPDLLRRIEWERFVSNCSAVTTIRAQATTTGRTVVVLDKRFDPTVRGLTDEERAARSARLAAARERFIEAFTAAGGLAPQDELESARQHIRHFRLRAIDFADSDTQASWFANNGAKHAYLDCADDNVSREKFAEPTPSTDGPKEIGFHGSTVPTDLGPDWKGRLDYDPNEPSEGRLWPLTPAEKAWLKRQGVPREQMSIELLPPFEAYRIKADRELTASRWER